MKATLFVAIIHVLLSFHTNAQVYKNYTVEDGLPSNEIYQVYQDRSGYIWIATDRGVSRFNGYEFENFNTANGIPDNTIFGFFEDSNGRLWLRSYNGVLGFYYQGDFHLVNISTYDQSFVVGMQEFNDGQIGVSYKTGGFLKVKMKSNSSQYVSHQFINAKSSLIDLLRYTKEDDKKINHLRKWCGNKVLIGSKLFFETETSQLYLKDSVLHVSTDHFRSYQTINMPYKAYYDIYCPDGSDKIYFAHGKGYSVYDKGNFHSVFKEYEVVDNISSVFKDSEGGVWLTSTTQGLLYAANTEVDVLLSDFKSENITHVAGIGETLFFSTDEDEIFGYKNGEVSAIETNGGQTRLLKRSGNRVLYSGGKTEIFSEDLSSIYIPAKGRCLNKNTLWAVDQKSVKKMQISPEPKVIESYESNLDQLDHYRFAIQNGGKLWLTKLVGMESFDLKTKRFQEVDIPEEWKLARIVDLDTTAEGSLLMGTLGAGVLIKKGQKYQQISEKDGLASNIINHVYNDHDSIIWVATIEGLSKVQVKSYAPLKVSITNFNRTHGLSSDYVNYVHLGDEKIYVATNQGINVFNKRMSGQRKSPNTHILALKINDRKVALSREFELEHDQNNIHVDFLGILYRANGDITYKYRLKGANSDWIYTSSRSADFVNLQSGSYTFELIAISPDGAESHPQTISFEISAPFWLKWWFILLEISLVIAIVVLIFYTRLRRLQKNISLKYELYKLENKALRAQLNPHFIFNALNSIQNFVSKNEVGESTRYLSKFSKLIRLVLESSNRDIVPLEKELELLELYFELEGLRFKKRLDYSIDVEKSINVYETEIPMFILQPYVENAIWHGIHHKEDGGFVKVNIANENGLIVCKVIDNGVGRSFSEKHKSEYKIGHKSMGLSLNEKRAEMINKLYGKEITVEFADLYPDAKVNVGTSVTIKIKQES